MALGPSSSQRGMCGQVLGKLPASNQAKCDCPLIGISSVRVKRRYSCWKCWGFLQVCQVYSFLIQKCNFLSFDIQQCFCVWGTSLCWTKFLMHLAELCLNGREISTVRTNIPWKMRQWKLRGKVALLKIKKKMCGNEGSCAAVGSGR